MNNEYNPNSPMEYADIYTALGAAQAELKNPKKDSQGYGYKYAALDQIIAILREVLPKYGLSFTQNLQSSDEEINVVCIETIVFHKSGQRLQPSWFKVPVEQGKMSLIQAIGSHITYARRYALSAVFGLASEEDIDGAVAKSSPAKKSKTIKTNKPQLTAKVEAEKVLYVSEKRQKVEDRLKALGALDYAASKNIDPAKCREVTLDSILALSDAEILAKVKQFEKEQEEAA